MRRLGRKAPTDWEHVDRWALRSLDVPAKPTPVVLGVNWYENFDRPVPPSSRAGRWYIGRGDLGLIRGGHAICAKPVGLGDAAGWRAFYDQGAEGACVGYAESRMMSLLNRRRYDARWLYHRAQEVDEWPGIDYDGTSVRAGLDVLRKEGHRRVVRGVSGALDASEGIQTNRWATGVEDIVETLGLGPNAVAIPLKNSWGADYPATVWLPLEVLDRLLREDGEAAVVTDR